MKKLDIVSAVYLGVFQASVKSSMPSATPSQYDVRNGALRVRPHFPEHTSISHAAPQAMRIEVGRSPGRIHVYRKRAHV